jgi:hypothetical protein
MCCNLSPSSVIAVVFLDASSGYSHYVLDGSSNPIWKDCVSAVLAVDDGVPPGLRLVVAFGKSFA